MNLHPLRVKFRSTEYLLTPGSLSQAQEDLGQLAGGKHPRGVGKPAEPGHVESQQQQTERIHPRRDHHDGEAVHLVRTER